MKHGRLSVILATILLATGCGGGGSVPSSFEQSSISSSAPISSSKESVPSSSSVSSKSTGPKKTTVAAHTLKDSNPPIDIESMGQVMNEDSWDSFRYASSSKFNGNYNYTYRSYSGGYQTIEAFTKNGYYVESNAGRLYYERKNGSTFYAYSSTSEGYLRSETTLNIQEKYTSRIQNEIYVHMFDFSNYEYDDWDGTYRYYASGFTAAAKFQGGYLTYLYYILGMNFFEIKATFETTIDIPQSYYYS